MCLALWLTVLRAGRGPNYYCLGRFMLSVFLLSAIALIWLGIFRRLFADRNFFGVIRVA